MCWFNMGIAQRSLDPPPPLCQTAKRGKKCPKLSWQAFTPPPLRAMPIYWTNTFQKGASLILVFVFFNKYRRSGLQSSWPGLVICSSLLGRWYPDNTLTGFPPDFTPCWYPDNTPFLPFLNYRISLTSYSCLFYVIIIIIIIIIYHHDYDNDDDDIIHHCHLLHQDGWVPN